jgi:hypothetical protein
LNRFSEHKSARRSREHIIPQALGGELVVDFLCEQCNSQLGSDIDTYLRGETSLRFWLGQSASAIPDLFEGAAKHLGFRGRTGDDWLDVIRKDKQYIPLRHQPDGSKIVTPESDFGFVEHMKRRLFPDELPESPMVRVTEDNRAVPLPPLVEVWPKPGPVATSMKDSNGSSAEREQPS